MSEVRALFVAAALLAFLAGACAADPEEATSSSTTGTTTTAGSGEDLTATTSPPPATTVASDTAPTTAPGEDTPTPPSGLEWVPEPFIDDGEALRVAPAARVPFGVLRYWSSDLAGWFGHTSGWVTFDEGPIHELADGYLAGTITQRTRDDRVIWRIGADGPDEQLIVADGDQTLLLEGAEPKADGGALIYFQRFEPGPPEDARSSLQVFDTDSGEVRELVQTGGWESGTSFDFLGGGLAVGRWSGEGYGALLVIDLDSGEIVHDTRDEACFDGEPGCIIYDAATVVGGDIYGFRGLWNEDAGVVDQQGLFRYDPATRRDELIAAFPWDDGQWYVEDLFGEDGASPAIVASLHDGDGQPLPAVRIDVGTGEAVTSPLVAFVRPGWLS